MDIKKWITVHPHGFLSKGQAVPVKKEQTKAEAIRLFFKKRKNLENKFNDDLQGERANDLQKILGEEFKGFKGQKAINKLVSEKRGHIKGAFFRQDFGYIDLIWGNDNLGLKHIIKRREETGIDVKNFLSDITDVVEKGVFLRKNNRGTFEIWHNKKMVIISPEYHNQKITFILTAYKKRKPN